MTDALFAFGHALLVGVGGDLPDTVTDAQGLADILRDPARCAYPPAQVHLLTGPQATRAALLTALEQLVQTAPAEAAVLVYFSGHGYRVAASGGESYYLLPYGYDLNRLAETALRGDEFAARLRALPTQRLLLLLDCCHAGGIGAAKAPGLTLTKAPLPPEALTLLREGRGRVLIASSQEHELSFAGKPYSAFTCALLETLCGVGVAKPDGYVRVADLALHAREVVPQRTRGQQHPILHFEQADNFVLAYYAGGESQLKDLPFALPTASMVEGGMTAGRDVQCRDLQESINETLDLLREYEEQRRLTNDPKTRRTAEKEIARLKADLERYRAEYQTAGCTAAQPPAPDLAGLRARLQRLDDVALDTLCMDHFPAVYDAFSRGLRRDEKLNLLLDYVRRHPEAAEQLAALLQR